MSIWTEVVSSSPLPKGARSKLGGKGRGLYALAQMGVLIPPTLCIVSTCFEHMLAQCVARAHVREVSDLRAELLATPLPGALREELSEWLREHAMVRWSVRSSGLDEDHHAHSFAGQHLTRLDVVGLEGLCEAIKQVFSSAYEDAALLYRARIGAPLVPEGMAVLIQPMLSPWRAGVMFTRDLDEDPSKRLISSVAGLGTGVVDGSSEGMTYRMERGSGYITSQQGASTARLEFEHLVMLDELAARLETHPEMGTWPGHDVEWAFVEGGASHKQMKLYALQVRPTSSKASTTKVHPDEVWTNANVGEALPGVGTPLTWSIIHEFSKKGFEQAFGSMGLDVPEEYELVGSFHGRVYLNLTQFMSIASAIPVMKPEVLFELAGGGGVEVVQKTYTKHSSLKFLARLPLTAARVTGSQLGLPFLSRAWTRYFEKKRDAFFARDLSRLSTRELLALWGEVDRIFHRNGLVMLAGSANFLMVYVLMREFLKLWGGEQAVQQDQVLMSALDVKSAEPGFELLQLGRLARRSLKLRRLILDHPAHEVLEALMAHRDRAEIAEFLSELERFRVRYGHRAPREAELATPRWREDSTFIFEVLKGFVSAPRLVTLREIERDHREKRQERDRALQSMFSGVSRQLFERFLELVRANARRRESLRALVVDALDMYRELALESAQRMVASGELAHCEDIFFLTSDEIRGQLAAEHPGRPIKLHALVRRVIYTHQSMMPDPPGTFIRRGDQFISEVSGRSPTRSSARRDDDGRTWTIYGLPGSSGRVGGVARVLSDPSQRAKLGHGDILVVPYADVGWTPLFLSAGGVVMSLGGPLSHACVVAREYGIPAVANAKQAMELIEDGDWLTVDGDQGVVIVEKATGRRSEEEEA